MKDQGTHAYLKRLMALPFLPHPHIEPIYSRLLEEASTDALRDLVQYIGHTWIHSTMWPPSSWSVYMETVRTNNDCEGWHRRLNSRGRQELPFYMLVQLLHEEAKLLSVQVKLISASKLQKRRRLKYRVLQQRLLDLWGEFSTGDISAMQLLKACSYLNGPSE